MSENRRGDFFTHTVDYDVIVEHTHLSFTQFIYSVLFIIACLVYLRCDLWKNLYYIHIWNLLPNSIQL